MNQGPILLDKIHLRTLRHKLAAKVPCRTKIFRKAARDRLGYKLTTRKPLSCREFAPSRLVMRPKLAASGLK